MRRDMSKVIVERPRWGHGFAAFGMRRSKFERASRDRTDHDVLPKMMPTRIAHTKGLNENLAPLERFLRSRVGRPWNRVYSELRAHLAPKRAIDMHILQHLYGFVCFARREDGEVWLYHRNGDRRERLEPERDLHFLYRRFTLYVCCDTGLLRERPPLRRKKPKKRKRERMPVVT
jgi:hypothetical protein